MSGHQQPVVIRQGEGEGERERGKYESVFFSPDPRVRSGVRGPRGHMITSVWFYQAAVSGKCIKPGQGRGTRQGGGEEFSFVG